VKSQADTTDAALKAAGITKVEKETVSVHSRGGEVIQKLMHDDPSGRSLRADRLELHDSLYGSQGAVAAWGHTDNGKRVEMDVKTGDKVLFAKYAGTEVKIEGADFLILREDDILAVQA